MGEGPLVLVVRETRSLADSVQLLLETVGFRVVPENRASAALDRLASDQDEPIRAVVVVCNQPNSEMLRGYPETFPAPARTLPLLVVGDRVAETRRNWPANVRFLSLPIEANRLVDQLGRMTSAREPESGNPTAPRL